MFTEWHSWDGRKKKADDINHQHLSNIYYYTHYTLREYYDNNTRIQILILLKKNFNGKILPYSPDPTFKFEMDRLTALGWLRPNGDIVIQKGFKDIKLGAVA